MFFYWTVSCTGTCMTQNFIIGYWYFLNKCCIKLLVWIKNSSFVASTFLAAGTFSIKNFYRFLLPALFFYSCIVWAQNINTVNRLIILQKKAVCIMNFKDQLFHSSPLFSENNILKFIDKITLENILLVNRSINRQVHPIFMISLHFQGICTDTKLAGL